MRARSVLADEAGETLVEILITILVISIGLTAIVAAMGSSIIASDAHQNMASGEVVIRDFADALRAKAAVAVDEDDFVRCADASALAPTAFDAPDGWTVAITQVEYWIPDANPANFPNGDFGDHDDCEAYMATKCIGIPIQDCDPAFDPGLQRVTIVASNDRDDYAGMDIDSRVIVRRGNRT